MNETVDPSQIQVASTPPARRRRWRSFLTPLILAIVAYFAWQYFDKVEAPTPAPAARNGPGGAPTSVRVADAQTGDMPIILDALGTVTSLSTVTVHSQVSGKLLEIGFKEGQFVKAGDFLAQVDSSPFQATLSQYQAQLQKDTAAVSQAQNDLARYQVLLKQNSISTQQVDDQTFLVTQDKAAAAADQAQIDSANLNIGYAHIVAPITGRLGLRLVDAGNYVTPGDASGIVVIAQMSPISVAFSIPEANLPQVAARLKAGAKLPVGVLDRANLKTIASGELETYDNAIDMTTGTIKLRAIFTNEDETLFPNQFVNVRLRVDTQSSAVLAPSAAVQIGANGSFVYVVGDDSAVSVRQVTGGASDQGKIAILSGLSAGERVVIDGVDRLRDGAKVVVTEGGPSAGATPAAGDKRRPRGQRTPKAGGDTVGTGAAPPTPQASATPAN
jgi:membrane fusion protein, multidrug efflux system